MIEVASDNHIGTTALKVKKSHLKYGRLDTIEEWKENCESGFYQDHDCDGQYACYYNGEVYAGKSCYSDDENHPKWATHVLWSSK